MKPFAPDERDDEVLDLDAERFEARVGVTGDVGVSGAALPAREEEERVETILDDGEQTNWNENPRNTEQAMLVLKKKGKEKRLLEKWRRVE